MFPVNFINSNYLHPVRGEVREEIQIANELEIDPQILNIPIEHASEEILLKQSMIKWCIEWLEIAESKGGGAWRKEEVMDSARKILDCYTEKSDILDLSHRELWKSLPENLTLQNLKYLKLVSCDLKSLPKRFHFPNLEYLNLSGNYLTKLPENLKNCSKLKVLWVMNAALDSLPEDFSFRKLEELDLECNNLKSFPQHFHCPALKKLSLTENEDLQELPMSLAYCLNLRTIDVDGTEVPEEMVRQIFEKQKELKYDEETAGSSEDDFNLRMNVIYCRNLQTLQVERTEVQEEMMRQIFQKQKELKYGEKVIKALDESNESSDNHSGLWIYEDSHLYSDLPVPDDSDLPLPRNSDLEAPFDSDLRVPDDSNLRLPREMIGNIAEFSTLLGKPSEH